MKKKIGRIAGLVLITIFAGAVMLAGVTGVWKDWLANAGDEPAGAGEPALAAAPVSVIRVEPELIEILDIYSGTIRPFERFTLAPEIAGRLKLLGKTEQGADLDEGDRVRRGDVLAVLDQRLLLARQQETTALLEQAQDEMRRLKELRQIDANSITEAEFQSRVTDLAVAKARVAIAQKNLDDATLTAPVDGVISRRYANPGESVNVHQPVFELVQVDDVLLVVGVPESRVREIELRRRTVERNRREAMHVGEQGQTAPYDHGDLNLTVYVELLDRDRYDRPWPSVEGKLYRIGETADDKSGLFEVEVLLPNKDGMLRPGLMARAKIVVDRIKACRLPVSTALYRDGEAHVFSVQGTPSDVTFLFWTVGRGTQYTARRYQLDRWIEQGPDLILPSLPEEHRTAVIRGQHRLVDGRPVRVVSPSGSGSGVPSPSDTPYVPAVGSKP